MVKRYEILEGDCLESLKGLPDGCVQCCVTSPPYFGLRDYGVDGQIGLEKTPQAYVERLVNVFREVRRVLRNDGTLWLNLGDSYNSHPGQRKTTDKVGAKQATNNGSNTSPSRHVEGLAAKQLIGIPWRVAFALQADGWYLRQDIIWHKPNSMPESVKDRCTKSHEYVFLLSKNESYYFDYESNQEPANRPEGPGNKSHYHAHQGVYPGDNPQKNIAKIGPREYRNRRSVWTINTESYNGAHFAVMPTKLVEPCVLAGSRPGDIILDPFGGSGTVGAVAVSLGRKAILCELNPKYCQLARGRIEGVTPSMFEVVESHQESSL